MKKILKVFLIFVILLLCNSKAFSIHKDGIYECSYQIDKYSTGYSNFLVDENGNTNSNVSLNNSPSLDSLINSGKCKFYPNINYLCKYPQGSCSVKIMTKGGHEVSCLGQTPSTNIVLNAAKNGKCIRKN